MNVYYTKKEFNDMKNSLMRENKALKKQVTNLTTKINELKMDLKQIQSDYNVLLETATEE